MGPVPNRFGTGFRWGSDSGPQLAGDRFVFGALADDPASGRARVRDTRKRAIGGRERGSSYGRGERSDFSPNPITSFMTRSSARCNVSLTVEGAIPSSSASSTSVHVRGVS